MARKRMISPSMWESLSFSELSDFSKLVFISLISHADDEGRGVAKAATVASMTFPNDENKRVADVKKALSEIALHMSVQFYSVNGRDYYAMTNWLDYQTINRPTKSKLPPPPPVGVGGVLPNHGELNDNSVNTHGVLTDNSLPNIKEVNIREDNIPPNNACACEKDQTEFETRLNAFCTKWGIVIDSNSPLLADFDFDKLDKAYSESKTFLQNESEYPFTKSLNWIVKNYQSIIGGKKFKDKKNNSGGNSKGVIDRWQAAHDRYSAEENKNDT